MSCNHVDWGHQACFQAAEICYRAHAELKKSGTPPLAESEPHYRTGYYTVDKLMGELVQKRWSAIFKVECRKGVGIALQPLLISLVVPRFNEG